MTQDASSAARRADKPEQHADGRGFASAIRSEEAEDGSLLDRLVQTVNGTMSTELFGEPRCFDGKCVWLHMCFLLGRDEVLTKWPHVYTLVSGFSTSCGASAGCAL